MLLRVKNFIAQSNATLISLWKKAGVWHKSIPLWKKTTVWFAILALIFCVLFLLLTFFDAIGGYDTYSILNFRLPKIALMFIMGAGASVSALLLQKLTHNRLADVGLIGLSDSGIFVLSILSMYAPILTDPFKNPLVYSLVIPVVIGAASMLTISLLYVLSIKRGVSPKRVVLMGIGLHVLFAGAATLVVYFNDGYQMNFFIRYLTGFIETKPLMIWGICGGIVIACLLVSFPMWKKIDILEASEQTAHAVGVRKELLKFAVFALVSIMVGATAAAVGSVALLGVLAPNVARALFGNKMVLLVPGTVLIGVNAVMLAQFLDTNVFHISAPVGIVIQLIIAPYFLYRAFRREKT